MGLLKSLLASQVEEIGQEPITPEEARRAAAEEALDQLIAARKSDAVLGTGGAPASRSHAAEGDRRLGSSRGAELRRPTGFGKRPNRVS